MTFTTISSAARRSLLGLVVALALAVAFFVASSPAKAATGSPIGKFQAATAKVGAPVGGKHHTGITLMNESRTEAPFNVRVLSPVDAAALARFLNRP
jgi:hypothetical protein